MAETGEVEDKHVVGVLRGDATALPFADECFDAVITSEVLEHIPDDVGALAELRRVLRRGGVLAVTVPSWLPEKINWMLSDEYHAPAAVGGHVRIYSATELKAKLRAAGLDVAGSHHAHALHSPYWWLKCAVGVDDDDHPLVRQLPPVPRMGHHPPAALDPHRRAGAVTGARQEPRALRGRRDEAWILPGVLSRSTSSTSTAGTSPRLQQPNGMIPWFPGGHCDPWNLVESAMALDVAGRHAEAMAAYRWLVDHPAAVGRLAQLLRRRRHRRGGQARHQRLRLHRHRRAAPLAVHRRRATTPRRCGRRSNER